MPLYPLQSTLEAAIFAKDDEAQRIAHLVDLAEAAADLANGGKGGARGLPPVCFTALAAAASVNRDGPVLTFVTLLGKSLQVRLQLPADKTRAFCVDVMALVRAEGQRRRHAATTPGFPSFPS